MDFVNDNGDDLALMYIDYVSDEANADKTFDDFFDDCGVEEELRNDFVVACILRQAQRYLDERSE